MKKIISAILSLAMLLSLSCPAFAAETTATATDAEIAAFAEKYHITVDEVKNLSDNLSIALENLGDIPIDETVTVPISENLTLTLAPDETPNTYAVTPGYYSYSSTATLKNIFGAAVVTLTAHGLFLIRNGTCSPSDAYGTYDALVWNVTSNSTALGPSGGYSTYVRVSFDGQFDLGIDPVSITLKTFSMTCTLYANADLGCSYHWSTQD